MIKRIVYQLSRHAPFTAVGATTGIIVMVIILFANTPKEISTALFYTLHPIHIVLSAVATTSMYRLHRKGKLWAAILIGYTGSIGIATISDAIIPYLGGSLLGITMEFHLPFVETSKLPFIGIDTWIIVNSGAVIGIVIGCWKPTTRYAHTGHVLLSTWVSLFNFTAFGILSWSPLLLLIFLFLFLAVWLPCCLSDIIYPLLWVRETT